MYINTINSIDDKLLIGTVTYVFIVIQNGHYYYIMSVMLFANGKPFVELRILPNPTCLAINVVQS